MNRLLLFIAGALLFGAVSLAVGYFLWDTKALIEGGAAFALAFIPAAGTLAWVVIAYRNAPDMRLLASLGGSGIRMMIALGGGWFLTTNFSDLFQSEFYYWLVWFYLVLLFFEIGVLVQNSGQMNHQPQTTSVGQSGGNE